MPRARPHAHNMPTVLQKVSCLVFKSSLVSTVCLVGLSVVMRVATLRWQAFVTLHTQAAQQTGINQSGHSKQGKAQNCPPWSRYLHLARAIQMVFDHALE
jgi:hypothetical protein